MYISKRLRGVLDRLVVTINKYFTFLDLNFCSTTISRTYKCATNIGTFEIVTNLPKLLRNESKLRHFQKYYNYLLVTLLTPNKNGNRKSQCLTSNCNLLPLDVKFLFIVATSLVRARILNSK